MGWLDFFASIIASLAGIAWPAALFGCVWIFRNEIVSLLPHLHLKHKDTEISFRLEKAEATAKQITDDLPPQATLPPPDPTRFDQLADLSPVAAMVEIRRDLEAALRETAQRVRPAELHRRSSPRQLAQQLRNDMLLDDHTFALFMEMLDIGNLAAHERNVDISPAQVRRYRKLADQVIFALDIVPSTG